MLDYATSAAFWFGAVLLLTSQVSYFYQLNSLDSVLVSRSAAVPELQARDLAGPWAFTGMLFVFLVASLGIYVLLCMLSPTLLEGWYRIADPAASIDKNAFETTFPLYVAAILMGITRPIPGLERLTSIQRDIFHYWIGVPMVVVNTSGNFATQIFAENNKPEAMNSLISRLLSDEWLNTFSAYGDLQYFRRQVSLMHLDREADIQDVLSGSVREKKLVIESLVFIATVATTRRGGGRRLERLANQLNVGLPQTGPNIWEFSAAALVLVFAFTTLVYLIPMLHGVVDLVIGKRAEGSDFWPLEPTYSAQYVAAQLIPIFVSVLIAILWMQRHGKDRSLANPTPLELFNRCTPVLLAVIAVVIAFDYAQALLDRGFQNSIYNGTAFNYLYFRLGLNFLHSLIAVAAIFIIVSYIATTRAPAEPRHKAIWIGSLMVIVGVLALFFAEARVKYLFRRESATDLVILVVGLNIVAALLALGMAVFYLGPRSRKAQVQPTLDPIQP